MPSPSGAEREGGAEYAERIIQGTAELRGVEGLMMSFKVGWPVSLVLSKKSLTKYQLLFRHLFFAKHVQRLLSKDSWREHQDTKQLELKGLMMASYQLRHRMLHFMQNLVYYMMVEVIEPHWHHFMDDLKKLCGLKVREWPQAGGGSGGGRRGRDEGETGTLDDVLRRHEQFQDLCLKECLLTNIGLLKSLTRVMISCLHFGDQGGVFAAEREAQEAADREREKEEDKQEKAAELLQRRRSSVGSGTASVQSAGLGPRRSLSGSRRIENLKRRSSSMRSALDTKRYKEYIQRSQEGFDASLQVFASHLWHDAEGHYHSHLNNLCARLDYNGFFSKTSRRMVP
ncbi:Spc97 [Ectocarpus siliculosus]|uniref:Spindle pole body component n=1 Tax=Ectocarpus siliculosus TaxID=2880 RepID=D8LBZ6_ECTSI|nr:Spc97 [Ectocarpus siliculosus]|eukprot:CBN79179.1 Spc97 [Ectocarpus siliculosus]